MTAPDKAVCKAENCRQTIPAIRAENGAQYCDEKCRNRERKRKQRAHALTTGTPTTEPAPQRCCANQTCGKPIPPTRGANAKYCDQACYKQAKTVRESGYNREYKRTSRKLLALQRERRRVETALRELKLDLAPTSQKEIATRALIDELQAKYEAAIDTAEAHRDAAKRAATIALRLARESATLLPQHELTLLVRLDHDEES